jgi:hypothetical protein
MHPASRPDYCSPVTVRAALHGPTSSGTAVKIGLNFVVPLVVSNLGVLAATRTAKT